MITEAAGQLRLRLESKCAAEHFPDSAAYRPTPRSVDAVVAVVDVAAGW
jgi:hypothetical protein